MRPGLFRHRPGSRRSAGVAAIEFAIMAPLLIVMITCLIELGLATRDSLRAQSAAAAGAYYAMQNGFDVSGITNAVVKGTGAVGMTASPAPTTYCGCPSASAIGTVACNATCTDGIAARQYALVSASIARTTVLNANLGLPATITRYAIVRLP
jgi:Flp pilus assembly protein TadG